MSTGTKTKRPSPRRAPTRPAPKFSSEAASFITAAVADGLAIQHRFKAEPIYARTGKGYMAPSGVAEMIAQHLLRPEAGI